MVDMREILHAPCKWCGYSGAGYWQPMKHAETCPWYFVGGAEERIAKLKSGDIPLTASTQREQELQSEVERLREALRNARDFMEHEYMSSWDCCTPPRTPFSMEPRDHKNLIDPYSFDDMVRVADLIRATDATLAGQTEPPAVKVKRLQWEDHLNADPCAHTDFGEYYLRKINDGRGRYSLFFNDNWLATGSRQWVEDHANTHFTSLITACLETQQGGGRE